MSYYRQPVTKSIIITALISAIIGGIIGAYIVSEQEHSPIEPRAESSPQSPADIPQGAANSVIPAIAKKLTPAVVGIATVKVDYDIFFRPIESRSVGSGVIADKEGHILTNDHVVGGADKITVLLSDGRTYPGKRLWSDPSLDLAVVKIDAPNLTIAPLGDSDKVSVGELAVAIGNPLGLRFQRTVTAGIISALDRTLVVAEGERQTIMQNLIQTDASINPGNSGGPLINAEGQVIGINSVKASEAEAMGFAIPINLAKPIIKSIIKHGRFVKPWLGILGIDREIASFYNANIRITRGIFVGKVEPGSPADKAGIREGDVILEIEGQPINTMAKLRMIIYNLGVGETINVKILRDKKEKNIKLTLEEMPPGEGR
ncbi:MAG: serine protease Do [Thermosediminibacterales bacterium]|nr:serine protease Do [Thermosediminibacterales bacterium]